jgi:O-antigen/teichoic acid export membrane protein
MGDGSGSKSDLETAAVYRRLARNSAALAGGAAASAIFMMLAAVVNARALSAREFGLLVLFQSATMLVATFTSFATQQPVIKLGSSALADGDLSRLGQIIGLGLLLDAVAAITGTAIAFAFLGLGGDWIGLSGAQFDLALLFAGSLLFSGYLTSNGIFRLLNRFGLLSLIQAGCASAIFAATLFLYATGAPFADYCWAWAVFYALNSQMPLIAGLYLARRAGIPITVAAGKMQRSEIRTVLAYCWTTWGMATADTVRSNGDSLLVGAVVSVEAAGIYNVAKQLAGVLRKLNAVYASAVFPEISTLSAHGEEESAGRVRRRMLWVGGAVGMVAVVAALFIGRPILGLLFGERFETAWLPLVILTAAAAAQLISHTLSIYVQVYVGPRRLFHAYLLAIAIFVVAIAPLTSILAITGTALAQLLFALVLTYLCHLTLRSAPNAA